MTRRTRGSVEGAFAFLHPAWDVWGAFVPHRRSLALPLVRDWFARRFRQTANEELRQQAREQASGAASPWSESDDPDLIGFGPAAPELPLFGT